MKTISLKLFPIRHSLFGGTFLAALIAMAFATLPAAAQTIFWGAPTTISGDTDVSTLGTGLYAYTGGSGAATVNGVAFAAGNSGTAWGANVTLANLGSTYSGFNGAAAPFTSLSAAYQTVLKGGAYGSSGNPTVTLNGLTANERYLVQIWLNDSRATGRFATTSGNGVSLLYCVGNTVGGVGQYALGYFIATGTSATFALTPSQAGGQQLNAIQVRDLGTATLSSGTWTQTGTGVQNWGTGGNWSGSTIAEGNAANANFNSVDVPTTDINPQLDQPRVINSLTFGDTATGTAGNWLLSGVSTIYGFLVLDGTTPTITVNTLGTSKTATISAAIFGNQGLTKAGNGTLSLTGSAVYTGATTVNGGTLSAGSLPPSSALTVASGATLKCTGYGIMGGTTANIAAWTIAGTINNVQNYNSQTMPASVTLNNGTMNGSVLTTYGSFYAQSAVTITANGNANSISTANIAGSSVTFNTPLVTDVLAISGYLGGTGANGLTVTKSGLGTLTLSGVNTYTGGTTINASGGTLQIGGAGKLGSGSYAGAISIGSGSTFEYSSSASQTLSGNITGSGALTKDTSSASTLTLSGSANAYTGATTVNAGTLLVSSPGILASSSAVTVASGATLGGNGTINGTVNVSAGGLLAPGGASTIGTLTLANNSATSLTLNGNTLLFDLPNTGTTCDLIAISGGSGALVLNGANTILLNDPNGAVPAGTYTLMTYASKTGSGTLTFQNGTATQGNATLTVGATSVTLTVAAGGLAGLDIWKGTVSGVWDGGILNWTRDGAASQAYTAGDAVTFDDTGSVAATISSGSTVSPASVFFNNSANNYTVSAVIGGSTGLTKAGTGTTTLSAANQYTGLTTVNAGTLKWGVANALLSGNLAINNGGTVNMNGVADTVGTVTLNYGGTIQTSWSGILLKTGAGGFVTTGGTVDSWPGIGLGGGFTYNTAGGNETTATIGAVDMNSAGRTFNIADGVQAIDVDIAGNIYSTGAGNYNITKSGAGTLRLSSGGNYNLGTGATIIQDGVLLLNKAASANAVGGSGLIQIGDSVGAAGSAILRHATGSGNGQITQNNAVTINSDGLWDLNAHTETTTGALTVNSGGQVTAGGGNLSVGALTVNGSVNTGGGNLTGTTLALTAGSIATGAGTYNLGGDVTLTGASSASTISGILALGTAVRTFTIADGAAATDMDLQAQITSGAGGGITKAGPGLIQLSGANTYSGDTTISAGTLKLATGGTLANTPNITVASGATFDVSTPTTALALGAGQTLKASATGGNTTATITVASSKNLTLGGGLAFTALGSANTIAPLTVAGTAGSLDLNNNPVTVTTTTALTAGSYKLIAKSGSATVTGTPGTLTVNGSSTAAGTATPTLRVTSGELYLDVYPAALTLGNNGPICAGSTLNLTANAVSGGTYAWTGPSFTSSLQNPSIANATTAVSATYHCTITVNGLTSADATTLATVNALPTITLGSSPTVSYGTTSANLPYSATGNGANQYIITYDSTAHTAGFTDGGSFAALPSSPIAITVPASAPIATYNGTITVKNSATGCTSSGTAFTVTVIKATPTIGGVTASPSISYGTANVSLSGTVSAGSGYPADGETVSVTINGNTQNASIAGGAGGFSISFPTATIPPSPTAYTINYAYAGNAAGANTLNAATPDTSTALTVTGIKVPVLTYANASGIGRQITLAEIQTAGLASSQVSPTYTITLPSASSFLGGSVITNGAGTIILCEPSSTPGSDHFDYTVSDGVSSATATVNITFTNAVSVSKPEISVGVGGVVNGTMYGIPGVQYDVQRSTTASGTYTTLTANLTPPNPIQAASDGKISFQDTAPPLGSGFYRTIQH